MLADAGALEKDVSALSEAVQTALDAANGVFSYRTPASDGNGDSGNSGGTNPAENPNGNTELADIADEEVPLAGSVATGAEFTNIGNEDVPLTGDIGGETREVNAPSAAVQDGQENAQAETLGEEMSLEEIVDEKTPLAAAPAQSMEMNGGILGALAAAFGALLLLLGKRKKEEEKEQ